MRDLAEKWIAPPHWATAAIAVPGLAVKSRIGLRQHLVSGDLAAWAGASKLPSRGVGAFGQVSGEAFCVQVARDRLLAVSAGPLDVAPGWHEAGFAVTPVSAGLHVFEAEGAALDGLVARATTLDPEARSPSAALTFAGAHAIVYRHGDALRIHVERGLAPYLWGWMEKAARNIAAA